MNLTRISIWANAILYVWISQSLIRGAIIVGTDPGWDKMQLGIKFIFIIVLCLAVLYSAICILGLLLKKSWGRPITFYWNICLAVIVGGVPLITLPTFIMQEGANIFENFFNGKIILATLLACILIFLSFVLNRDKTKEYFLSTEKCNVPQPT